MHYDGIEWSQMDSGTTWSLYHVCGSSSSNVFAVGGRGTILHYDGDVWSRMSTPTSRPLYGVWAASSCDAFAVGGGGDGVVLHYAGES